MPQEYDKGLQGNANLNKKIINLGELNELAYKDLILMINMSYLVGKVVFSLVHGKKNGFFWGLL